MQLRTFVRLTWAGVLLAGVVTVTSPAPAGAATATTTYSPAAQQLAADWSVSLDEAQARIDRQDDVAALGAAAANSLGDRFGGVWVDHIHGGTVVVQAVGGVPAAELDRLATEHRLTGHAVGAEVTYSSAYLYNAVRAIGTAAAEVGRGAPGQISTAVRTDLNLVELTEPSTLTPAQRELLASVRAQYGAALIEVRDDAPDEPAACSGIYCDPQLRGGVAINSSTGTGCTAGFMTKKPDGSKWVLTAGHCFYNSGYNPWHTWATRNADGVTTRQLGASVHWWWYGMGPGVADAGIFNITNSAVEQPKGWVYASNNNQQPITAALPWAASTWFGLYTCKRGRTTGEQCGIILSDATFVTYSDGVSLFPVAKTAVYGCKGDSGGPAYAGTTGIGITSGGKMNINSNCGNLSYLQPLHLALLGHGVSLL